MNLEVEFLKKTHGISIKKSKDPSSIVCDSIPENLNKKRINIKIFISMISRINQESTEKSKLLLTFENLSLVTSPFFCKAPRFPSGKSWLRVRTKIPMMT